jgi:hypothetical protein
MTNNLLVRIPGQCIAAGSRDLPNAATAEQDYQRAVVDVPGIGKVRLTYKRFSDKRARSNYFYWTVESAELIG